MGQFLAILVHGNFKWVFMATDSQEEIGFELGKDGQTVFRSRN